MSGARTDLVENVRLARKTHTIEIARSLHEVLSEGQSLKFSGDSFASMYMPWIFCQNNSMSGTFYSPQI